MDEDQQLLFESAGGDSVPDVPLPNVPLPDDRPDASGVEEGTNPPVAEEAMVVAFGLGLGSCLVRFICSNLYISGIDYYMRRKVFGSLKVCFIYRFCIGFILFVLLYS